MSAIQAKLTVYSLPRMVGFYQEFLEGEVLDQTDAYASIKIGYTTLELYVGPKQEQLIAIELQSAEQLQQVLAQHLVIKQPMQIRQYPSGQQAFIATIQDPEGNLVQMSCYQYIPSIKEVT